jgi:hypothetical protein
LSVASNTGRRGSTGVAERLPGWRRRGLGLELQAVFAVIISIFSPFLRNTPRGNRQMLCRVRGTKRVGEEYSDVGVASGVPNLRRDIHYDEGGEQLPLGSSCSPPCSPSATGAAWRGAAACGSGWSSLWQQGPTGRRRPLSASGALPRCHPRPSGALRPCQRVASAPGRPPEKRPADCSYLAAQEYALTMALPVAMVLAGIPSNTTL